MVTGSSDESKPPSIIEPKPIIVENTISSIALVADGQQFVSGDENGKIRCWRTEDGVEVGAQMDAESAICCLATSQDGKWIVTGTKSSRVTVWNAESREALTWFAREKGANAVDISLDGAKVAIAWDDRALSVYSLPDCKKLGAARSCNFHMVKFSPDGLLFACSVERSKPSSLSIYNSQNADFLRDIQISTQSVVWTSDSEQLFALSSDGSIYCVDVSDGKTLSQWLIHSTDSPTCISLSSNGAFIAASADASISFWDTFTHEQIGFVIHYPGPVDYVAISSNFNLLIGGSLGITLQDLHSVLSSLYLDDQVGGS